MSFAASPGAALLPRQLKRTTGSKLRPPGN
jgi:hypothetical protein